MILREHIVVGLDLGTSHVCVAVGERLRDGSLSIIGFGEAESRGVRKGEIVDTEAAAIAIRAAIAQAEENSGVEIVHVTVALSGGHIRSFNNHGFTPITGENLIITQSDVANAVRNAEHINLPVDHDAIHSLQQHFTVDGQEGVLDATGMSGSRLEAAAHVIHGVRTRLQNSLRAVKAVGLEVDDAVFGGLATSLAVLTPHDNEIGCLVIDFGGGTTEFVVYVRNSIVLSGVIPVGGDHLTNDVALGLKLSPILADRIKKEQGTVQGTEIPLNQIIPIQHELHFVDRRDISRHTLCQILQLRAEETFSLIKREIQQNRIALDYLGAGIVLCGGSAQLKGMDALAQSVFGLPVRLGQVCDVAGNAQVIQMSRYATAVGLVKYSMATQAPRFSAPRLSTFTHRLASFFARARNIF